MNTPEKMLYSQMMYGESYTLVSPFKFKVIDPRHVKHLRDKSGKITAIEIDGKQYRSKKGDGD